MVNQQMPTGRPDNVSQANMNNLNAASSLLRSAFVMPPNATASARNTDAFRSRSADSRPANTNTGAGINIDDDEADWVDLPMDLPLPPQQMPAPSMPAMPAMPRFRGPAIIRKCSPRVDQWQELERRSFRIDRSKFTMHVAVLHSNASTSVR